MEIISSLVRTEISVSSVSREEEEFVVEGETLGMPSKVYVRPEEIGDMIGVFLSWRAIAYFLRWPFLYARWYLERQDLERQLRSFGIILSLSLIGVLLLGGRGALRAFPLQGAAALLSFAVFAFVAALVTERRSLLYGAVMLAEVAEHLLLYAAGAEATSYATWALAPLAVLAIIGWLLQRRAAEQDGGNPHAKALFRNGYILISLYAGILLWSFGSHLSAAAWRLYVPLLGFAAYFLWRFALTLRLPQLYFGIIYLALGYVVLVRSIPGMPAAYQGLPILALAIGMMLVASSYHEALEFRRLHPLYLAGMILSLLALIPVLDSRLAMLLYLAAMATHYFWMHREGARKLTVDQPGDQFVLWTAFLFANGAAYLALLLFFLYGFEPAPLILLAALAFSLNELKMGFAQPRSLFRRRTQHLYWAGLFWTVFVAVTLRWLGSAHPWPSRAPFAVPFVVVGIMVGLWTLRTYRVEAQRQHLGHSLLDASYLLIAVSYLLPSVSGETRLVASVVLTILYLLVFLILYGVTQEPYLVHGVTVALLFFLSHLLAGLTARPLAQALLLSAVGLLSMLTVLIRPPVAAVRRHTLTLSWFLLSGLALYAALPSHRATLLVSTIWAAAYLLGSVAVERATQATPQNASS
ncbi:MAG: hypothetical protein HYY96_07105 [Candidatus Tectomicrobia bacterium]|nr:hypothetical protein [Candidatus Tectomicrobia bacterium]